MPACSSFIRLGQQGIVAIGRGEQGAARFVQGEQIFVLEQNRHFPKLARGRRGKFDDFTTFQFFPCPIRLVETKSDYIGSSAVLWSAARQSAAATALFPIC